MFYGGTARHPSYVRASSRRAQQTNEVSGEVDFEAKILGGRVSI